jgi:mono/diheme cytochrome c family protein
MKIFNIFALLIILAGILSSCEYNRRTTGWEYGQDMIHSKAYETYSPNPNYKNGRTMQTSVEGTIPREMIPYAFQKNDTDRLEAARTLINNVELTPENLEKGKENFKIYCSTCHGEKGDGKGLIFVNKKYPFPPASLLSDKMKANPEADIYHVITVGFGIMPGHGSMIRPEDRWKIAMYVKNVLQKQ